MDLKDQIKDGSDNPGASTSAPAGGSNDPTRKKKERQEGGADAQKETPVRIVGGEEELEEHRS